MSADQPAYPIGDRGELGPILEKLDALRQRSTLILLARGLAWSAWVWLVSVTVFGALLLFIPSPPVLRAVLVLGQVAIAIGFVWRLVLIPWRGRRGRRVWALYCEEKLPHLNKRLVTCVDLAEEGEGGDPFASNPVASMLLNDTAKAFGRFNPGKALPSAQIRNALLLAAAPFALAVLGKFVAPDFVSGVFSSLYQLDRSSPSFVEYHRPRIAVQPGDAEVPRGASLTLRAKVTAGFGSKVKSTPVVSIVAAGRAPSEEPLAAVEGDPAAFELTLHDIQTPLHYEVALGSSRSPRHLISVFDPPAVDGIVSTVTPPAYTRAAARRVEGTFIEALEGSQLSIEVTSTALLTSAQLVSEAGEPMAATIQEGSAIFAFGVDRSVDHKVVITDNTGHSNLEPPVLSIVTVADKQPEISVKRPGADWEIHPIGEVELHAEARDDFGLKEFSLEYQINGGPIQRVPLFTSTASGGASTAASGDYTMFLEDLKVAVGDVILYRFRASDTRPGLDRAAATSQPYFVTVRPYEQRFVAGATGGGGEGLSPPNQREVIVATSRLIEMEVEIDAGEMASKVRDIAAMQAGVRTQTQAFLRQMRGRSDLPDQAQRLAHIEAALEDMSTAGAQLSKVAPREALAPENSALSHLLAAAAGLPKTNGQGGGGGGAPPPSLLGQKLSSERDKFEARDGLAPEVDKALAEAIERARALTQRQKEFAETIRREAPEDGGGGGQGGGQPASSSRANRSESKSPASPVRERVNREEMLQRVEEAKREIAKLQDELLEIAKSAPEITRDLEQALRNAARDLNRLGNAVENEQWDQAEAASARAFDQLQQLQLALEEVRRDNQISPERQLLARVLALREQQQHLRSRTPGIAQANPQRRDELTEEQRALATDARRAAQDAQSAGPPAPGAAAAQGLGSAAQSMESAAARMGSRQADRAAESQQQALSELERVAAALEEHLRDLPRDAAADIRRALTELQALKRSLETALSRTNAQDGGEIGDTPGGSPSEAPGSPSPSAPGGNAQAGGGNGGGLSRVGGAPRDQRGGEYSDSGPAATPTHLFDAGAMRVQLKTIEHLLESADIASPLVDSLANLAANDMWTAPNAGRDGGTDFSGEFLKLLGRLEDLLAEELMKKNQLQQLQQTPAEELPPRYGEWARRYFEALGAQRSAEIEPRQQ